MRRGHAIAADLGLAALAAALSACGDEGSAGPSPLSTPRAPVRTVIGVRTFFGLEPLSAIFFDAAISGPGSATLDASVNWTFAGNDLDLYVTNTDCSSDLSMFLEKCSIMARADSGSAKPERLTMPVSAGVYRTWVANFGPGAESGTLEVGLTQ